LIFTCVGLLEIICFLCTLFVQHRKYVYFQEKKLCSRSFFQICHMKVLRSFSPPKSLSQHQHERKCNHFFFSQNISHRWTLLLKNVKWIINEIYIRLSFTSQLCKQTRNMMEIFHQYFYYPLHILFYFTGYTFHISMRREWNFKSGFPTTIQKGKRFSTKQQEKGNFRRKKKMPNEIYKFKYSFNRIISVFNKKMKYCYVSHFVLVCFFLFFAFEFSLEVWEKWSDRVWFEIGVFRIFRGSNPEKKLAWLLSLVNFLAF
jgi:hypothetical protein